MNRMACSRFKKKGGLYILTGLESASAVLRAKAEHACQGIDEVIESLPD